MRALKGIKNLILRLCCFEVFDRSKQNKHLFNFIVENPTKIKNKNDFYKSGKPPLNLKKLFYKCRTIMLKIPKPEIFHNFLAYVKNFTYICLIN